MFNASGDLLYVGIAYDPVTRWTQHRSAPWAADVAERWVEWFPNRETAAAAEREAIRTELPEHNVIDHPVNELHVAAIISDKARTRNARKVPAVAAEERTAPRRLIDVIGPPTPAQARRLLVLLGLANA